ncbi:MAG: KpsF/GutQ family sugar-phosphate isomerase [Novosphingobium sp.]
MNDDYLTRLLAGAPDKNGILARGREVVRIEAEALALLEKRLDGNFIEACQAIVRTKRQLVVTGMGKSGHIARKIASTFAATGTPAIYVHPGEASHGDLGILVEGDVLLVLSNSGNTAELRPILRYAQRAGIPIIGVAARRNSLVIELADIALLLPAAREACPANLAPTTSTTLQLALGDALAMTVMDLRGVSRQQLSALHPGGMIGLALTPAREIMHHRDLPLVGTTAEMPHVISAMTSGCCGLAGVVDEAGALVGIITDGDLRRHFHVLQSATAGEVMTPAPKVIVGAMPAGDALRFLNDNEITAAFVVEDSRGAKVPVGIIHIHDLLRFGLA